MRLSQCRRVITELTRQRLPVFLWGPPGVGKSDTFAAVAQDLELPTIEIRAVLWDAVDVKGIPSVHLVRREANGQVTESGVTRFNPPEILPLDGEGIIFLDELPQAVGMVQSAFLQLVLPPHRLGEYQLPPGWAIHAAGNRVQDRTGANKLISALANRFGCHLEVEVSHEDWNEWAIGHGVHPSIRAFHAFSKDHLFSFDPTSGDMAFASPRSWSFADRIVKSGLPNDLLLPALTGCVGKAASAAYMAFRELYLSLPKMSDILAAPETYGVPKEPSVLYAIGGALADACKGADQAKLTKIVKYGVRLPQEHTTLLLLDALKINQAVGMLPPVHEWCRKHGNLFTAS